MDLILIGSSVLILFILTIIEKILNKDQNN